MIDYGVYIPNCLECLPSTMYVEEIEYGTRTTKWGFEIPPEKMDSDGNFIRPRWAKVLWKANNINNVNVGEYVLLKHGHWSSSILIITNDEKKKVWYISPKSYKDGVMAVSKEKPKILYEY